MWKQNCGFSSHRIFCVRKWNFKSQNILRVEYLWFLMQWPEWHECAGATGPWVKAVLEVLLFTVPSWRWPLLGFFVCFLSYYQAVKNQLTYDKNPDIRHKSWPKAAKTTYRVNTPIRRRVLNSVRGPYPRAQISITQSPCGSIMTLSRALRKSCILATPGLHIVLHLGMTIIADSRVIRQHWQWQAVGWGPVKDVKFCFHTSNLIGLPKIWNSAPALPFGLTTNDLRKMWSSASALPSCIGYQRYEVQLLHISSALPGLLKVWSFASAFPLCLYYQRSEVLLSILPLGQDFERSRSSSALVLPGLPNMGKSTSAFHLCRDLQRVKFHFRTSACLDCQIPEVPLPYFRSTRNRKISFFFRTCSTRTSKYGCPLPHFISAGTSKELKFRFHTSALPWLPKMWSSAFSVPLYVLVMHSHTNLYVFRETS